MIFSTPTRSILALAVLGLIAAGCHGHLKHGHIPPGQAKKVLTHPDHHHD